VVKQKFQNPIAIKGLSFCVQIQTPTKRKMVVLYSNPYIKTNLNAT